MIFICVHLNRLDLHECRSMILKGTKTRLVKFVYKQKRSTEGCSKFKFYFFFLPQTFIHRSMKLSLNRTTIYKHIVHGIELHAAFEERENKQKNAKF